MNFILITNNPDIAAYAVKSGVNKVLLDLEINGKLQRQGHLDTLISKHSPADILALRKVVPVGDLIVRINPINRSSEQEINQVIEYGADGLMLPMFRTAEETTIFTRLIAGRAKVILLFETGDAVKNIKSILKTTKFDQAHIGLNDLHLDLDLTFMLEPMIKGVIENICEDLRNAKIPFGIGGIARIGEGLIPAELVLSEHIRLGSRWVILSRSFHRNATTIDDLHNKCDFTKELTRLRLSFEKLRRADFGERQCARAQIEAKLAFVVEKIQRKRRGV